MNVGDKVRIEGDETVYVVAGIMEGRGFWLTVEEDEYDGYDADLIVQDNRIILSDERSRYYRGMDLPPINPA